MSKKKTKKQKVISDYRKKIKAVSVSVPTKTPIKESTPIKTKTSSKKITKPAQEEEINYDTRELRENKAYVVKDLKKTILISSVIIAVILGLWWATVVQGLTLNDLPWL